MQILVPMHPKNSKIHSGHKKIIEYAKEFGDPIVIIYNNKNIDTTNQIESLNKINIESKIIKLPPINKKIQKKIINATNFFINLYKNQLIVERHIRRARQSIIRHYLSRTPVSKSEVFRIYGPEPGHFFIKSFLELTSRNTCVICPYMIKPPDNIRYQTMTSKLKPSQQKFLPYIKRLLNDSKYLYKKGSNEKLVKELNSYHKKLKFQIKDITVYEGGIFEGRLEVVGISFPNKKGSVVIEEIDYYI